MADSGIGNQLAGIGTSLGAMFVNLSAEYPDILSAIVLIFGVAGIFISASGIFEFFKMGRRDGHAGGFGSITWKLIAGSSLVDLAFWTNVWADTLWTVSDPLDISAYVAQGGETNAKVVIYAVVGFLMLTGYVTIGRAYLAVSRIGYLSPEARDNVIGAAIARVVAGSAMVASLYIAQAIDESTGFNWLMN